MGGKRYSTEQIILKRDRSGASISISNRSSGAEERPRKIPLYHSLFTGRVALNECTSSTWNGSSCADTVAGQTTSSVSARAGKSYGRELAVGMHSHAAATQFVERHDSNRLLHNWVKCLELPSKVSLSPSTRSRFGSAGAKNRSQESPLAPNRLAGPQSLCEPTGGGAHFSLATTTGSSALSR